MESNKRAAIAIAIIEGKTYKWIAETFNTNHMNIARIKKKFKVYNQYSRKKFHRENEPV